MSNMTWNQFKEHIDILLKEQNISGDREIDFIDKSNPACKKVGEDDGGLYCPCLTSSEDGIQIY